MGNRSYVVIKQTRGKETFYSPALYLHWNGGPESVYGFLDYARAHDVRTETAYGMARLCQIACNFFGGTLSVGLENVCGAKSLENFQPGDNGLFVVEWKDGKRTVERMVSHWVSEPESEFGGHSEPRWFTPEEVAEEERAAYRHEYHTGEKPIKRDIAEKNDRFFVDNAHCDHPSKAALASIGCA